MRIAISLVFIFCTVCSLARDYTFERITSWDGLSQNNVLAIHQDDNGYIWFGTYDGVNRYDGYEFIVFRSEANNPNSMSSNLIDCLTGDHLNNIWVGTFSRGVCKIDNTNNVVTRFMNTPENPNLLTSNTIQTIYADHKNNVWVGTVNGLNLIAHQPDGTYKISHFYSKDSLPGSLLHSNIQFISEDSKGRIFISTINSLELLKEYGEGEVKNDFYHIIVDTKHGLYDIREAIEVPEGYIFSNQLGISLLRYNDNNPEEPKVTNFEYHPSYEIQVDFEGNIWSAGHNGLFKFERRPGEKIPYVLTNHYTQGVNDNQLNNQFIRFLHFDRNGILWLGTNGGGVLKCNTTKTKFRHYKHTDVEGSLSVSKVFGLYEDKEHNVWVSTEGGGLNLLTRDNNKKYENGFISIPVNPPTQQNFAFQMIQLSNKKVPTYWVGTGYMNRLIELEKVNNSWKTKELFPVEQLTHQVMAVCQDENETIWLGTYEGGLGKYIPGENGGRFINYRQEFGDLNTNIIRSIYEDSKGRLWIGTNLGLMLLTPEQKMMDSLEYTLFQNDPNDPTTINNSYTVPIIETYNGEIWVGTFGSGINIYIEGSSFTNGTFKAITTEDGLPNNTIKQIIEDDLGNLWITTNNGVSKIDKGRKNIRNFDIHDGLQDLEFIDLTGIKLHDGEILIGGVKGFNAFYPNEIKEDLIPPVLVINHLEVNNKKVKINEEIDGNIILKKELNQTESITLKHTQNNFRIYFAALQFASPEGNKYKYKLDGFDKDWISTDVDARFAIYTNMKAGKYIFKLLASNSDGIWADTPKTLSIWLKPPFWITAWFRITAILFIIAVTSGIIWFRFYIIKKRNIMLEVEIEKRLGEIRDKNKLLIEQAQALNETNTQLEERQQVIEEQSEEMRAQKDAIEEQSIKLLKQKEALEETNATKDKFYSILAHDLKGPFNTLLGYLELLYMKIEKYDNEKRKEKLKVALDSSNVLFRLVQNLLQWSRSQRGLIPFKPIESRITDEIDQVLSVYDGIAHEKGIALNYNTTDDALSAYVDPDMFKTILRNLLSNAVKYSSAGGEININVSPKDKSYILFEVSDNGTGIPASVINDLFRIDNKYSTPGTNDEKGTGLGLVLCKEFVDKHNGKIWIESEEGKGTTISFTLPAISN